MYLAPVSITTTVRTEATCRRSSISIVSIVNSLFHWTKQGSLLLSTLGLLVEEYNPPVERNHLSIVPIDAREVDLGCKFYLRRYVGVVWTAMDFQSVYAILVDTLDDHGLGLRIEDLWQQTYMRRPQDGSIPIRHQQIISILETIGACLWSLVNLFARTWYPTARPYQHPCLSPPSPAPPEVGSCAVP
jgi:hypothetical protein